MKVTAPGKWRSLAMLGLTLMSFSACKKDAHVEPVTTTETSQAILADHPTFKGANLAITFTNSAPISLSNKSNITISGIATTSITLNNCSNITITNCKIGPNAGVGIQIYQCANVKVSSCYIFNVTSGVYAILSQGINVAYNQAKNMLGPYPRGQFVQFNNVTGTGNRVNYNKFQNVLGQSYPEDAINLYQSSGTYADPIQVNGNQIRGGGPSTTGGGIVLGDKGGSYVTAQWNILVDPGQYGMAIAGGTNMIMNSNTIYSKQLSFSNVGLLYWNQSGKSSSAITMKGNNINFTASGGYINNSYVPYGGLVPSGWGSNYYNKSLGEATLPTTLVTIP